MNPHTILRAVRRRLVQRVAIAAAALAVLPNVAGAQGLSPVAGVALTVMVPLHTALDQLGAPRLVGARDGWAELETTIAVVANAPYELRARGSAPATVRDLTGGYRAVDASGVVVARGAKVRGPVALRFRVPFDGASDASPTLPRDLEVELAAGSPARRVTITPTASTAR